MESLPEEMKFELVKFINDNNSFMSVLLLDKQFNRIASSFIQKKKVEFSTLRVEEETTKAFPQEFGCSWFSLHTKFTTSCFKLPNGTLHGKLISLSEKCKEEKTFVDGKLDGLRFIKGQHFVSGLEKYFSEFHGVEQWKEGKREGLCYYVSRKYYCWELTEEKIQTIFFSDGEISGVRTEDFFLCGRSEKSVFLGEKNVKLF